MGELSTANVLKNAFIAGTKRLERQRNLINDMNVFPVPDGDTGTNMTMTANSAVDAVMAVGEQVSLVANALASGSLRGARGNSGVIFSQLVRGFSRTVGEADTFDLDLMARACQAAVDCAYKAVLSPKEGTILTVAKAMADKANECKNLSLESFCDEVIAYGAETLERTPDMLPILKEAGVVDAGGQGLVEFLSGAMDYVLGRETLDISALSKVDITGAAFANEQVAVPEADIKYGYCTEMIVNLEKSYDGATEAGFKAFLESIGDSVVCVSDDSIVKVHVHTNHPGLVFEKGLEYGYLTNLKVDNMRIEHHEKVIRMAEHAKVELAEYGFVVVSAGDGLKDIFTSLKVDCIIQGGQTMNPSAADILAGIQSVAAKNIFVLPNNKNIILAAGQAADMDESEKNIMVISTANISQGVAAMMAFDSTMALDANVAHMEEAKDSVKCGQVTYAVRSTTVSGTFVNEGDYIGIHDDGVEAGSGIVQVMFDMVDAMVDEDSEIITIYYGADADPDQAERLADILGDRYEDCDVELYAGGQPVYYYIVSVE